MILDHMFTKKKTHYELSLEVIIQSLQQTEVKINCFLKVIPIIIIF